MSNRKTTKTDICQSVTDQVIERLEAGVLPWHCPMERDGGAVSIPENAATGAAYNGVNIVNLWLFAALKGYNSGRWMTYKQAQATGGQVRKGEKSAPGVFYKTIEKDSEETDADGNPKVDRIPLVRGFSLFNLDQIDGLDDKREDANPGPRYDFTPIQAGERLLAAAGVTVHEGGPDAFYRPATDEITMPDRNRFADDADFYRVYAHELTHATKHESRCDRQPYQTNLENGAYAFEELVAQLGSAFVSAHLGLPPYLDNDAAYIGNWLQSLKNDKRLIFKASAQAQQAADWIMQRFNEYTTGKEAA